MKYFFIDESGDTTFYSKRGKLLVGSDGCTSYFQICIACIPDPVTVRKKIMQLQKKILADPYYTGIPSFEKRRDKFIFHASEDVPEIRKQFFQLIRELNIESHTIIVDKRVALTKSKYFEQSDAFYNRIVQELFSHGVSFLDQEKNIIYFEKRLKKNKQNALARSISHAIEGFNFTYPFEVIVQQPHREVCLQLSDYINRAIQRVHTIQESRFYDYICNKETFVYQLYTTDNFLQNKKAPKEPSDGT